MAGSQGTLSTRELAFCDLDRELATTRRVLERVPEEHFAWKPHEKSMTLEQLAGHVATMPIWCALSLEQDGLNFTSPPHIPREFKSRDALLSVFDENAAKAQSAFQRMDDAALEQTWTLKNADQVMHIASRAYVLRVWCVNHMVHHRGQLCLFLKMLGVPVPAVYFNSADEPEMKFD
ncbi:MAG TPA: DinB family protein [Lacipirellulaceae bacterium]|nr:DinB family protein [Lacipirellulaceae bacterium]